MSLPETCWTNRAPHLHSHYREASPPLARLTVSHSDALQASLASSSSFFSSYPPRVAWLLASSSSASEAARIHTRRLRPGSTSLLLPCCMDQSNMSTFRALRWAPVEREREVFAWQPEALRSDIGQCVYEADERLSEFLFLLAIRPSCRRGLMMILQSKSV